MTAVTAHEAETYERLQQNQPANLFFWHNMLSSSFFLTVFSIFSLLT
jgi:hypothetical protein